MNNAEIDLPLTKVAPVQITQQGDDALSGLFFPYRANLSVDLATNWEGRTHLVHLAGDYAFQEGAVGINSPIRGILVREIEYRVDVTSRYNSTEAQDTPGSLVLKHGQLFLMATRLGDKIDNDPYGVPIAQGFDAGAAEQACGFRRWSIAIQENGDTRVIQKFEALAAKP